MTDPNPAEDALRSINENSPSPEGEADSPFIKFEGGAFSAYIAPGMEIIPVNLIQPYEGNIAALRAERPDLFEKIQELTRSDANFIQHGLNLTVNRLGQLEELTQATKEYAYRLLAALREHAVRPGLHNELVAQNRELIQTAEQDLAEDREAYVDAMVSTTKVSLRNVEFTAGKNGKPTLKADYARTPYAFYRHLSSPETPEKFLDLANPTASAILVRTAQKDDQPAMIGIQIRSNANSLYPNTPAATAAGMVDAKMQKGEMVPPDTEFFADNAKKELAEEIGIPERDIANITATAFTQDHVSIHTEVTFLADLSLSAEEMVQRSNETAIAAGESYGFDFSENFVFIKSELATIEKFLTVARVHMPSTHAAALVALAVSMKQEELSRREGLDIVQQKAELQNYVNWLQAAVSDNYRNTDSIVSEHWKSALIENGELVINKPEGFDPTLTPEEQGLPNTRTELESLGLIAWSAEQTKREFRFPAEPAYSWIFDVDGVITDILTKKVESSEIIKLLIKKLSKGEPITFNTGRSIEFVREQVLKLLETEIPDPKMLDGIFVVGEKSGTWGQYIDGQWVESYDDTPGNQNARIPFLQGLCKDIITEAGMNIIIDETKKTMVTLEMPAGVDLAEFQSQQVILMQRLAEELKTYALDKSFRLDATTIAIDIEQIALGGKKAASKKVTEMMREKGFTPKKFITVGDSPSDSDMRLGLEEEGYYARHVHVGDKDLVGEGAIGSNTQQRGQYANGTLAILRMDPRFI